MLDYLNKNMNQHRYNIQPISNGPTVQVQNGNKILPCAKATFKMYHKLSHNAQSTHIFDNLHTCLILSTGKLCDDDCIENFTKYKVKVVKKLGNYNWKTRRYKWIMEYPLGDISIKATIFIATYAPENRTKKTRIGTIFSRIRISPRQINLYQNNQPWAFPIHGPPYPQK